MARADAALQGCWGSSRIHPGPKSMRRTKCAAGNSLCSRCCCCFFSHITSDHPSAKKKEGRPGSLLPFPVGFCCAPGKRGHQQRAHNIWRWRSHRVLRAAASRHFSAHADPFFFFPKEKSRHGEKWPLQSWRLLEHSVCPAVQSCDIHCSMQGSFDLVSLLPLRLYFWWLRVLLFFSFCLTEALRIHIEAFEAQKPQIQQGWFGCSLPRVPRWLQSKALQPS